MSRFDNLIEQLLIQLNNKSKIPFFCRRYIVIFNLLNNSKNDIIDLYDILYIKKIKVFFGIKKKKKTFDEIIELSEKKHKFDLSNNIVNTKNYRRSHHRDNYLHHITIKNIILLKNKLYKIILNKIIKKGIFFYKLAESVKYYYKKINMNKKKNKRLINDITNIVKILATIKSNDKVNRLCYLLCSQLNPLTYILKISTDNIDENNRKIKYETISPNIFNQYLAKIRIHKNYLFYDEDDSIIYNTYKNITKKEKEIDFKKFSNY